MVSDPAIVTIGAGRMGRGIALAFAYAGHRIGVVDLKPRSAGASDALAADMRRELAGDLAFLVSVDALAERDIPKVLDRIGFIAADGAAAAIGAATIIFEGVPETMAAKSDCFAAVSEHARPDTIVASTTSTIPADDLAPLVAHPERFLNAHWLNPAHLMPLVELSPCAATDESVIARLRALLTDIGKVPVLCRAGPGYIVPRIQALAMNEAARIVEEGIASAEDVDAAVRAGFGIRFAVLGLLEFIDWGGCDILHRASGFLSENLGERFVAPAIIERHMAEHKRGLRDGQGFYDFSSIDQDEYRAGRMRDFVALLRQREMMPRPAASPDR